MLTPSIFQVATKGLAMDAHRILISCPELRRINVTDLVSAGLAVAGSLPSMGMGILILCPEFKRINVSNLVSAGVAVAGSLPSMGREENQEFEHHAQLCS